VGAAASSGGVATAGLDARGSDIGSGNKSVSTRRNGITRSTCGSGVRETLSPNPSHAIDANAAAWQISDKATGRRKLFKPPNHPFEPDFVRTCPILCSICCLERRQLVASNGASELARALLAQSRD
jgi:hypothetical protein